MDEQQVLDDAHTPSSCPAPPVRTHSIGALGHWGIGALGHWGVVWPISVTPYAICASAHLANPPDPHPSFPFTVPAMRNAGSTASCPDGQLLTAGGYWDDTEAHALTSSPVRADTNAPHVEAGLDGAALGAWWGLSRA